MAGDPGYAPKPAPLQDDPKLIELAQWAQRELEAIGRQFTNFDVIQQNVLYSPPPKPRDGMIAVADGSHWNPGRGIGQYTYLSGTWFYNGPDLPPTPPDLSPYLQKASNLSDLASKPTSRTNLGISTVGNTGQWADILGKPAFGNVIGYNVNVAGGVPLLQASGHYEAFDGSHIANIPGPNTWPYPAIGTSIVGGYAGGSDVGWGGAVAGVNLGHWITYYAWTCGLTSSTYLQQWSNLGGTWYNLSGASGGSNYTGPVPWVRLA